jgi:choline dehydrogenase
MIAVNNAKNYGPNPTSAAFIEACAELGYPRTDDFNDPDRMEGTGWHHINVRNGRRHGAYAAYLEPILGKRPNLTVSANSVATKLVFKGKKCTGVRYVQNGESKTANVTGEVIVCGGAMESPKLLLLSGIGNPEQLKQHGIAVTADVPGVGENFHNHVLTGVVYETKGPVPPPNQNLSEAALFCKSEPGWMGPDIQIAFVHVPFDIIIGQNNPNAVSILPGVVRPLSRGWIRLASSDPMERPLVNAAYLTDRSDLRRLADSVKLARDIFNTKAFSEWLTGKELLPGPDFAGDDKLEDFVRLRADSYHHQVGSCKMGVDNMAVVDPQLRVYGVEGVRVADASVMPFIVSGNCHAAILAIAEKCSDMIKADHGLN